MTIKKIISGGQTGADQGALDAAIKLGIPHGGWIPKGRKTENGPLSEKYHLIEMPTADYPKRTKKNIVESDGTLIVSHGKLTGGSALTKEYAEGLNRPCLHIDFNSTNYFRAAVKVAHWVQVNKIEVLNVAGPRASKDPKIYEATVRLIESVYHLSLINENIPDLKEPPHMLPKNVNEAVDQLIEALPLKERVSISKMPEVEHDMLNMRLGQYVRNNFNLWRGNDSLMESCRKIAGKAELHPDSASQIIIDELWKRLRETHRIRIVTNDHG